MKIRFLYIILIFLFVPQVLYGQQGKINIDTINFSSLQRVKKIPNFINKYLKKNSVKFDYTYNQKRFKVGDDFNRNNKSRYVYLITKNERYYTISYLYGGKSLENKTLIFNYQNNSILCFYNLSMFKKEKMDIDILKDQFFKNQYYPDGADL